MKISRKDVPTRNVDAALDIAPLFDGTDFKFDVALGKLQGSHPTRANHVSDRVYFILSGAFTVRVGQKTYEAQTHDTFVIPAGVPHGISGKGEFLIVTAPPFAPENEEEISGRQV
ncbi:MAG TPA: cupin domain-containing protein [Candidatus Saccharimonadales bacterium]|jgi:mannose-6-phosphate isomerase-like protein (cupin superfamily)